MEIHLQLRRVLGRRTLGFVDVGFVSSTDNLIIKPPKMPTAELFAHLASVLGSVAAVVGPTTVGLGVAPTWAGTRARARHALAALIPAGNRFLERGRYCRIEVNDGGPVTQAGGLCGCYGSERSRLVHASFVVAFLFLSRRDLGKTCLVDTALQRTWGVVAINIAAGLSYDKILSKAFTAVTRYHMKFLDQSASARRVIWWHQVFFRQPATLIIRAAERTEQKEYADLTAAARTLSSDYGLRVLIDASNNALPPSSLYTLRQMVYDVEPMPRSMLERVPELKSLHEALKREGLDDVVWECLGGIPAECQLLQRTWKRKERTQDFKRIVVDYVQVGFGKAIRQRNEVLRASGNAEGFKKLYKDFEHASFVSEGRLDELGLERPSPDKVLRLVANRGPSGIKETGTGVLVPATSFMSIVLRYQLDEVPAFSQLGDWTTKNK